MKIWGCPLVETGTWTLLMKRKVKFLDIQWSNQLSYHLQDSIGEIFYEDRDSGYFNSFDKNIDFPVFDDDW